MLPDFTSMLSIGISDLQLKKQLAELTQLASEGPDRQFYKEVALGVDLHLLTDAKFHRLSSFLEWNRKALTTFRAAGIRRGPSRATAHIGVEMAIDAGLKEETKSRAAYLAALQCGVKQGFLLTRLAAEKRPFIKFFEHLHQEGPEIHSREQARYEFRFSRMLLGRPHLAPTPEELLFIAQFFAQSAAEIEGAVPALMKELIEQIQAAQKNDLNPSAELMA